MSETPDGPVLVSQAAAGPSPAGVRPIPLVLTAAALIGIAALFMTANGVNVEGFAAVQAFTRALPDPFWSMVTVCGTGIGAFALLSPVLTRWPRWFAAAIPSAALAGIYSNGVKHLFASPRPALTLDASRIHVIGETLRHNAFPSGHSVTAFTLAAVLVFASTKPIRTASWAVPAAALIAISRIAVGAHWPADLAGGAAGGWVCGALGVAIVDRWRAWNTVVGVRAMAVVSIGIGLSLFIVDLGYPQAMVLQYGLGLVAVASGCVAFARPRCDDLLPVAR